MELFVRINALLKEFPRLWKCLKANVYPESFLANVLGFGPKLCERFPQYLMCFVGLYLLCGVLTAFFHFRLGQKPLSSIPRQIRTAVSVCCAAVLLPLLVMLAKVCAYIVRYNVAPLQGKGDYLRYAGESFGNIFCVALVFTGTLLAVWTPARSVLRYLKIYRLRGIPHLIFEVGTGLYLLCVILLATAFGNPLLYGLMIPAGFLLGAIQSAGHIAEEHSPQVPEGLAPQDIQNLEEAFHSPESEPFRKGRWLD